MVVEEISEFQHFGRDHRTAVRRLGVALKIILVVDIGFIERSKGNEFGHNGGTQVIR